MAAGKTLTAPLDRVKLLLQTRGGLQGGALKAAARGGGVWDALVVIGREEGFLGYWKGNVPQVCDWTLALRMQAYNVKSTRELTAASVYSGFGSAKVTVLPFIASLQQALPLCT